MAEKTYQELVKAIDDFDDNYDYGHGFDIEAWNAGRKPLVDELTKWHNTPR